MLDRGDGVQTSCGTDVATTDQCYTFGQATTSLLLFKTNPYVPITGNWTGSGTVKIGIFNPSTTEWFLDANGDGQRVGCSATADYCYRYRPETGWLPVVGNWTGSANNRVKVGVYNPTNGDWFLDANDNGQFDNVTQPCSATVDYCYRFRSDTPGNYLPVVGNWDGNANRRAKIGVFDKTNGAWYLDASDNGRFDDCAVDYCHHFGQAGDLPVVGDWNGDGTIDLGVFRNGTWMLDANGNRVFDGCSIDRCHSSFGAAGDRPVAWTKSVVRAN